MSKNDEAPKLNLTKPMRCRNGEEVRILCTDGPSPEPIVGFVDGRLLRWYINGSYWGAVEPEPYDLINIPEKRTAWVYECNDEFAPTTFLKVRDERSETLDNDCLSRIRVVFETGRMDE